MKKIVYLILIGTTIYLNILYDWKDGAMVLSAELSFLLFCLLEMGFVRLRMKSEIQVKKEMAEQGEEVPVYLQIRNESIFPTEVSITVFISYVGENRRIKRKWKINLGGGKEEYIVKQILAEKCGKMQIELGKVSVSDWWGGFSFPKKIKQQVGICIIPKPCPVHLTVSHKTKWFPVESEEYAQDRSGDDNTEVYEIREYRNGDRLQKVHWKVSAKQDNLSVKEYSYPIGAGVVILLEQGQIDGRRTGNRNVFLQGIVSVSMAMLEKKCFHYIAWKDKKEPFVHRILIRDEESFYSFLPELLELQTESLETDMEEWYRYQYRNAIYSSVLVFTNTLEIQINHQEKMKIRQGIEKFFETTEIVV